MSKPPSAPRVAAIVGPYMSGKTTLLESLLHAAGAIPRKGTVKEGNTVGDAAPEARARQMSVEASVAATTYLDETWTFIDCPGSVEFSQESANALMVADAAVVVVEADPTRAPMAAPILKFLDDHGIPHTIFLNKVDNLTDPGKIAETLRALQPMSPHPLVLREYPIHAGSFITGYEDLSLERAFKANPGHPSEQIPIPDTIKDEAMIARQEMLEAISSLDDALMEKLLEEQVPTREEVYATLTKGFKGDQIVPVLLGSADKDLGVRRLLKLLRHEAPEAGETARRLGIVPGKDAVVQVWKTVYGQHVGKQSLARVWSGEVSEGMTFSAGRPSSITKPFGAKQEKVLKAGPGEIVALGRMEGVKTGAVLAVGNPPEIAWPAPMQAMTALAVKCAKSGDEVKLSTAIQRLLDEDPSFALEQNAETQERVIWGQGEIHLKVALDRIRRWGVEVTSSQPTIPYRETIRKPIKQHGRYKHQSGGHGAFGDVHIEFKPLARGEGLKFSDTIVGGVVPKQYIPAVENGFLEFAKQGPLGFPMVDVEAVLFFGSFHTVDSSEMAFKAATRVAMVEGLPQCNPVLLEPIVEIHISVPSEHTSKAQKIITSHRAGQILGFDAKAGWEGWDVVDGYLPQSELQGIIVELRSQTQGVGSFTWAFHHLQELEGRDADKVVEARKKALAEA
ncbi:elongation factor G [Mesoterricola sediminis]|uniref:Elongation factor G n=1 Tax=Mesoterricola sediminis TaxID=2927980 RepID=A0AA48KC62_9BACT|nr:elongation factor G [Mesoterricola sediminis]BDU76686.1 elongation factor G [Mesoterricola sediminis]